MYGRKLEWQIDLTNVKKNDKYLDLFQTYYYSDYCTNHGGNKSDEAKSAFFEKYKIFGQYYINDRLFINPLIIKIETIPTITLEQWFTYAHFSYNDSFKKYNLSVNENHVMKILNDFKKEKDADRLKSISNGEDFIKYVFDRIEVIRKEFNSMIDNAMTVCRELPDFNNYINS